MSSPFNIFRKHQKAMFAVLGIAVMFAFIFGDAILGRGSRSAAQRQDPVVVDWKFDQYGPLRESELQNTRQLLSRFNEFMRVLMSELGGMPPRVPAVTEREAVNTLMLSRLAEQKGMVISDKSIQNSLKSSFMHPDGTPVTSAELKAALNASGMTEYQLFAALRTRILAGQMMSLFRQGFGVDTPVQRFEYYNRIERKVKAELAPLKAEDFVVKVADPDNATLEKFFAAHKDKYPPVPYENYVRSMAAGQKWSDEYAKPGEPGFKLPYKAQFQYIKLPRSVYVEEVEKEITDKEIAEYYEKEKDNKFRAIELPKDEKPKEEKKDAAKADAAKTDAAKADAKPEDKKDAAAAKYEPLDKVKDTIRKALAEERAAKRMDDVLGKLKQAMDNYSLIRADWEAKRLDVKDAPEPPAPSLTELATADKATAAQTDLVSGFDLSQKYDLGKSFTVVQVPTQFPGIMRPERRSIIQMLYNSPDSVRDYTAQESEDDDGNRFIYWRTRQEQPRVPTLAEVRDTVVQDWKLIQARQLALAEAKQLADKAKADPRPFKEVFPDRKIIETNEFSWLTPNLISPQAPPTLSTVEGVPDPGENFMRVVTELPVGQVGVAQDYSEDTVYVARVTGTAYTPDAYGSLFLTNIRNYEKYSHAAVENWTGVYNAWVDQLKAEAGYKEERKLDPGRTTQQGQQPDDEGDDA